MPVTRLPVPGFECDVGPRVRCTISLCRACLQERFVLHRLQRCIGPTLDGAKQFLFVARAEGDRDSGCTGAGRSSDAVHVGLGIDRHVVIDDVRDVVDIDTSRGDIGRDQHRDASTPEGIHRLGPHVLGLVSVDRVGIDRRAPQEACQSIGAVLGLGEDERPLDGLGTQEAAKKLLLLCPIDLVEMLGDRLDRRGLRIGLDADGIQQDRIGK